MINRIRKYHRAFKKLEFEKQHSVVSSILSPLLSLLGVVVSMFALTLALKLQYRANEIQEMNLRLIQANYEAEEVLKATRAFSGQQ